jgi:mannose-1-phosphate guanylyltransferase / mannose-6-phosphate isomerase
MSRLLPVILSGGAGSRLWPVSRESFPKPFMRLPDGESLLQKTLRRAAPLAEGGEVLTVTNREYLFRSRDDYTEVLAAGPKVATPFILEPMGRNTAPAICVAALRARAVSGADTVLLVLSSDHLIENQAAFAAAVEIARAQARAGRIVTFGVSPTGPATGFGYIEVGESLGASARASLR